MFITYFAVTALAVVANVFSGVASVARWGPVMRRLGPAMKATGVPESWAVFPIGTSKIAGGIGLLLGLLGVPLIGEAAAIGLVLFFVCATYTHVRVHHYDTGFFLAAGFFLPLAVAALSLGLAVR